MKSSLKIFLSELYEIDPDLKAHESELLPLLEKLLKADPAQSPDPAFVSRLRMQLRTNTSLSSPLSQSSTMWNKLLYALGGAVAVAIIIPAVMIGMNTPSLSGGSKAPLFGYNVENTGTKAFGPLSQISVMTAESQSAVVGGRGGGGGVGIAPPAMPMNYGTAETMQEPALDSKMIAPWPVIDYEYVFEGDLPTLDASVDVFKRTSKASSLPISSLGSLNFGMIDAGSFGGMNVDTVSFTQKQPFGYQIFANLRESSINIDAQWDQWPQSNCQTEECWKAEQLTIDQVPTDAAIISIAQKFALDHGINLTHYGEPEVNNEWRKQYEAEQNTSLRYVPDSVSVVFPFTIENGPTYDQSGMKAGIMMSVSAKHKKVMSVYGLMDRTYLKSEYAGVTDEAAIQKYLENMNQWGGIMPMVREGTGPSSTTKKATVTLGAPTVGYVVYYTYQNAVSEELLVPSLLFPVKSTQGTETYFYPQNIIVPLAKELFDEQNALPRPMPFEDVKAM